MIEVKGKRVLVRGDLDVEGADNPRTESVRQVVKWLLEKGAEKIRVIGHRETEFAICEVLRNEFPGVEFDDKIRENPGEKKNDEEFAKSLAGTRDVYINEAFATSHRNHASIVALPKVMKAEGKQVELGPRFKEELEKLNKIRESVSARNEKAVLVIGGTKVEDKQKFAQEMGDKFGAVLRGGLLPGVELREDRLDISDGCIESYVKTISEAEVILAAGVMGKYEEESASKGTKEILMAIANNQKAYKVAGGGDIETAIGRYGLTDKFDWISVGGGAMLEYLKTGTLVGLEALVQD